MTAVLGTDKFTHWRFILLNLRKSHRNFADSVKYARQLITSNYGRDFGWIVKHNKKVICELEDCQFADMFWDSYKIIPIEKDESFYKKTDEFTFVNRRTLEELSDVLVAGESQNLLEFDRGIFRRLYLLPRNWTETFILNTYQFLKDFNLVK